MSPSKLGELACGIFAMLDAPGEVITCQIVIEDYGLVLSSVYRQDEYLVVKRRGSTYLVREFMDLSTDREFLLRFRREKWYR